MAELADELQPRAGYDGLDKSRANSFRTSHRLTRLVKISDSRDQPQGIHFDQSIR